MLFKQPQYEGSDVNHSLEDRTEKYSEIRSLIILLEALDKISEQITSKLSLDFNLPEPVNSLSKMSGLVLLLLATKKALTDIKQIYSEV